MLIQKVSHLYSMLEYSRIDKIESELLDKFQIQLDVKRDDLIHPIISGNKWRKLKYLLLSLEEKNVTQLACMGGPHSNFLHALAYVCYLLGWKCKLYVRAYAQQPLTGTLKDCIKWGATIVYVNRIKFRQLRVEPPKTVDEFYWIEEGGMNYSAVLGISELFMELSTNYDVIVMASATGTSMAGLARGAKTYQPNTSILGISVLNNSLQQESNIHQLMKGKSGDFNIISGYEFGGFAKSNQLLDSFVDGFERQNGIPLEAVYSGKSFYAVYDLIAKNHFSAGDKILLIHCGGLQGKMTK